MLNNFKLLKETCWHLVFYQLGKGWEDKIKHPFISLERSPYLCVRHGKIDKLGRITGYGDYYLVKQIAKDKPLNFASSEITAMRAFCGYGD